jgi:hypothetical protein
MPHNPSNRGKPRARFTSPQERPGTSIWFSSDDNRESSWSYSIYEPPLQHVALSAGILQRTASARHVSVGRAQAVGPRRSICAEATSPLDVAVQAWSLDDCAERQIDFFATYKLVWLGFSQVGAVMKAGHRVAFGYDEEATGARRCLNQILVGLGTAVGAAFPRARCIEAVSDDLRRCLPL